MKRSKIGLSPFGMGELCYRDLELIQWGCLLIKPDMSKVITEPDFFKPMETYVPVKPDWSDLNETIEKILDNFKDYQYIISNREKVVEMYTYQNVCMYWYNFFANLNGERVSKITSVIPTYNNLPFLKLTVQSIRQNCYYKDQPIIIFAENCTDGTVNWLDANHKKLGIEYYIENDTDREDQRGIGGGIDYCVSKVKTEFVNILHSDFKST